MNTHARLQPGSVVIPTCDRPRLLRRAVRSVVDQSLPPRQVVVVDDGDDKVGTDVRDAMWRELKACGAAFIYLETPAPRSGPAAARNAGLAAASAPTVSFLDDDDVFFSDHLLMQHAMLEEQDGEGLVYAGAVVRSTRPGFPPGYQKNFAFDEARLLAANYIHTSSVTVGPTCADRLRFDTRLGVCEDWDYWIAVVRASLPVRRTDGVTSVYNLGDSDSSLTVAGQMTYRTFAEARSYVYSKWPARGEIAEALRDLVLFFDSRVLAVAAEGGEVMPWAWDALLVALEQVDRLSREEGPVSRQRGRGIVLRVLAEHRALRPVDCGDWRE